MDSHREEIRKLVHRIEEARVLTLSLQTELAEELDSIGQTKLHILTERGHFEIRRFNDPEEPCAVSRRQDVFDLREREAAV